MFANGETVVASNDDFNENARTTLASDQTISANSTAILDLVDNGNDCYDQGSNWNNGTHKYTVRRERPIQRQLDLLGAD